jgi:hypothetical protein
MRVYPHQGASQSRGVFEPGQHLLRATPEGDWLVSHTLTKKYLRRSVYIKFARFLAPLILAMLAQELSAQFLNGGMARVPRATQTLAAFGLAYGLLSVMSGPLHQSRQLGLAMIDNRRQLRMGTRVIATIGLGLSLATILMALDGPGRWVVEDLHGIDASLADQAQIALLWLTPMPLLTGLTRYYSGLLARMRRTEVVSASGIAGIGARILSVFVFLDMAFVQTQPILLPIAITLLGAGVEYLVMMWGHFRYVRPALTIGMPASDTTAEVTSDTEEHVICAADILRFLWPLAVIMIFQGASRPLINLVVSRGVDGTQALAVLTIVYALGHLHYGWINEIRSLAPAFRDEEGSLYYIRRFVVGCLAISLTLAFILFWTPLRDVILLDLIGVEAPIAALCVAPLMVFTLFPFVVTLRGYYHGVGLVNRVTDAMALSGPYRLVAIAFALWVLSATDLHGATLGVTALLCGFAAEAVGVTWGVRRRLAALQCS